MLWRYFLSGLVIGGKEEGKGNQRPKEYQGVFGYPGEFARKRIQKLVHYKKLLKNREGKPHMNE